MDPQQRLVLDCTYMALENAGITRAHLAGSDTGVFVGTCNHMCISDIVLLQKTNMYINLPSRWLDS